MTNKEYKTKIGEKDLKIVFNNLAEQASGNCTVQYGDTMVLATAVMASHERDVDFFPLTVEYEERFYAAGKILGSRFVRRESRPSDEAILTARVIDRAIRPLFNKNLKREIQVVATCLSWDTENDSDILGLTGASLALLTSDIPWSGPVAVVRVGQADGEFLINPTYEQRKTSKLDLVFAGIEEKGLPVGRQGDILINMIEAEGDEVTESAFLDALKFAKPYLKQLIEFQKEIAKEIGKEKVVVEEPFLDPVFEKEMRDLAGSKLERAIYQTDKASRHEAVSGLRKELIGFVAEKYPGMNKEKQTNIFFEKEVDRIVHENIIKSEKRPDGRKIDELREIQINTGVLPRTHGSGLFERGQTKSLSILTLGAPDDVKILEGMEFRGKKRFMHHYNFPPYSTGEVKPMRGPGRRDIGHGMLAEKALLPMVPSFEDFPYTIRIVTEILSSNGSSSMASATSSSVALMDAGVPIKRPVTGIALGLMSDENSNYKILTDIQGPEDHYGDMDFKIAGTSEGITAVQLDVKISGVNEKMIAEILERGKKARLEILEKIKTVIVAPRPALSPFAPRILILQINPQKIREVIGPGGKVINEIIAECGVSIDIEDSGKVFITAEKEEAAKKASEWIQNITREVRIGEVFHGKIKRILEFGAFAEILPGQEGLIHISQLAPYHVGKVEDVVKIGDIVPVKVISIDEQGRINLSLKAVNSQDAPKHRQ